MTQMANNLDTNKISRFNNPQEIARFNMIEQQIRTWEVLDPVVLDVLDRVPRENFVAESQKGLAFADIELPIGHGQTMLSPKLEGRILQAVHVKKSDKVLLVGTGSGYLAALLATLAQRDAVAPHWLAGMAIVGAVLLWYCTAMIYACIRSPTAHREAETAKAHRG